MRSAKHQFRALEDDMCDIAEILNKPDSPLHDATPFAFITTIQNQDLFAQVAHPPEGADTDVVSLEDYEVKDHVGKAYTRHSSTDDVYGSQRGS